MDDHITSTDEDLSFKDKHSFLLFIILSVSVASLIVAISMALYNGSGAAQLDLSRPGYVSVRSQVRKNDINFKTFSPSGHINKDVINDFQKTFDKEAKTIKAVDAFGGDPLNTDALGLEVPVTTD